MIADIVYGVAFVLTIFSVGVLYICWDSVTATRTAITPAEQMRERTPWPPPPPQVVQATYEKPMLALPRGDR